MVPIPSRIIGGHWWGSTSRSHRQWLQMFSSWKFWCFALDSLQPTGDEEAARRKLKEKAGEIQGDDTARLLRHLAWQGLARWGMQITSKSSCNNFWSRSTPESVLKIFQGSYSIVWTEIAFLSNQKHKESTKSFHQWFAGGDEAADGSQASLQRHKTCRICLLGPVEFEASLPFAGAEMWSNMNTTQQSEASNNQSRFVSRLQVFSQSSSESQVSDAWRAWRLRWSPLSAFPCWMQWHRNVALLSCSKSNEI